MVICEITVCDGDGGGGGDAGVRPSVLSVCSCDADLTIVGIVALFSFTSV